MVNKHFSLSIRNFFCVFFLFDGSAFTELTPYCLKYFTSIYEKKKVCFCIIVHCNRMQYLMFICQIKIMPDQVPLLECFYDCTFHTELFPLTFMFFFPIQINLFSNVAKMLFVLWLDLILNKSFPSPRL